MPAPTDVEWDYVAWNEMDSLDLHIRGKMFLNNGYQKQILQKMNLEKF